MSATADIDRFWTLASTAIGAIENLPAFEDEQESFFYEAGVTAALKMETSPETLRGVCAAARLCIDSNFRVKALGLLLRHFSVMQPDKIVCAIITGAESVLDNDADLHSDPTN